MPQGITLSDAELRDLARDPRVTLSDLALLSTDQRATYDALKTENQPPTWGRLAKNAASGVADYAKGHPAEAGGIAGGLAVAPFTGGLSLLPALGLTGLAGAGGAGYGMLASALSDQPSSSLPKTIPAAMKDVAVQGATQAGAEGAGRVVGAGLRGTANVIQNSTLPKRIADSFPTAAETLNRFGINPTTEKGAVKAAGIRKRSAESVRDLATHAERAGGQPISESDVTPYLAPAQKMAGDEGKAGIPGGSGIIRKRVDALFDAQFPYRDIPLTDAADVTRVLQDEGIAARESLQSAERPSRLQSVTADNLANGLRQVARKRIPGYQVANTELQGTIGAERAAADLKHAQVPLRGMGWRVLPGMGLAGAEYARSGDPLTSAAAGMLPIALGVPQISAPVAIGLYKAGKLPYALLAKVVGPEVLQQMGVTEMK